MNNLLDSMNYDKFLKQNKIDQGKEQDVGVTIFR